MSYEKRNKVAKFRFAMIGLGSMLLALWFGFLTVVDPVVGKVDECYTVNNPDHGERFLCDFKTDEGMKSIGFRRVEWKEYREQIGSIVTVPGRIQGTAVIPALFLSLMSLFSFYLSTRRVLTPPFIGWVSSDKDGL
ncbi:hypothetical protein [Aeromonas phage AerS_266]|nr:hypothetical protein [Aeromonas phage AerS_266]